MSSRIIYAIVGAFIGAGVNLLISLLAAAIQQQSFGNQFSQQSIWWFISLIMVGLLIGAWFGAQLYLHPQEPDSSQSASIDNRKTVTMTRLRAFISYGKLRGKGIHLSDIFLFGSRIDIETRD